MWVWITIFFLVYFFSWRSAIILARTALLTAALTYSLVVLNHYSSFHSDPEMFLISPWILIRPNDHAFFYLLCSRLLFALQLFIISSLPSSIVFIRYFSQFFPLPSASLFSSSILNTQKLLSDELSSLCISLLCILFLVSGSLNAFVTRYFNSIDFFKFI